MELLRSSSPHRENKRVKRGSANSADANKNNHSGRDNLNAVQVKSEPSSSRDGSSRSAKPHNQMRNTSSSSHSDSSSTCSSSCSTCSVASRRSYQLQKVKQEEEEVLQPKTECASELKSGSSSCADSGDDLPLLTPPSSPESIRNAVAASSEAERALMGHQGLIRVSSANANIPKSTAVAVHTKNCTRSSNSSRTLHVTSQGLAMVTAVTQRNANMPTSQASTSEYLLD